jgi:site-specific DNA-methyltransferase (adenine-specific)
MEKIELYNEDCIHGMRRIEKESIDLILTDPPYGVTECGWDSCLPPDSLFEQYNRIIKPNGAILLTATQPFATDLINANRRYFRYDIVWEKTMAPANCRWVREQ